MTKRREDTLYTIPAAATKAGVNERTLRRWVTDGKVQSVPIHGTSGIEMQAVYLEDVVAFRDKPEAHRRGKKKVTTS